MLFGFILFEYAAPQRNLEPLTLNLEDYNVDVENGPRNPIPFNSPGDDFTCQPGTCIYGFPVINDNRTGESYYFCGAQSQLENPGVCSIQASEDILTRISGSGAQVIGDDATNPLEVSKFGSTGCSILQLPQLTTWDLLAT